LRFCGRQFCNKKFYSATQKATGKDVAGWIEEVKGEGARKKKPVSPPSSGKQKAFLKCSVAVENIKKAMKQKRHSLQAEERQQLISDLEGLIAALKVEI